MAQTLRLAIGPAFFALVMALPLALPWQGRIALATFAWAIAWWVAQPLPWAIAALLPMLVFPATGVMAIKPTIGLYGQPIFFWIMGTVMLGYSLDKHGIARRFARWFLALPGVAASAPRLILAHMLVTGLISMFVSDAATIAMMLPMGLSLGQRVRALGGGDGTRARNLGPFLTLGTFYAAVAGGTGTILGLPHNAIAISLSEELAGRGISFFGWMAVGVPLFLALLLAFFLTLRLLLPIDGARLAPGVAAEPEGAAWSAAERRVLAVFATVVLLFALPSCLNLLLGAAHPLAIRVDKALDVWIVPPIALFLLFLVPSGRDGEALLTWKGDGRQVPWDAMLMCTGAVAMVDVLTKFGFIDFVAGLVKGAGLGSGALVYVAAFVVAWSTDMMSGTAAVTLYGSIFIPAAQATGHNPASMAMLIANVALGLTFPWAGAAAATAFSVGDIEIKRMIAIGIPATIVFALTAATIHVLFGSLV